MAGKAGFDEGGSLRTLGDRHALLWAWTWRIQQLQHIKTLVKVIDADNSTLCSAQRVSNSTFFLLADMLTLTRRSRDLLAAGCWPRRCAAALLGPHEPPQQPTALLPPLPLSAEGARGLAGSAPGGPPDERLQRASRLIGEN